MKSTQKFKFLGKVYTALSFFGRSGMEYQTSKEAAEANGQKEKSVRVKNKEYGGACRISECEIINERD